MSRGGKLLLLAAVAALVFAASPFVGAQSIGWSDAFADGVGARIFRELRLPRVVLAWFCGATLGLCGMVFQALFRNPLAEPTMLGVSSGAAFGAALYIFMGWNFSLAGLPGVSLCAFGGALTCVTALQCVARLRPDPRGVVLLLAGVALNFFFSSFVMILQYVGGYHDSYRLLRWTLGGLQAVGMGEALRVLPVFGLVLAASLAFYRELDLMLCGPEIAASRGVPLGPVRTTLFIVVSLCVALCVALCGPISFIGLMVPHLARLLVGAGHRDLTAASALLGGAFLTVCDTAARTCLAPMELPVGIITSFMGAPFFLWLLLSRRV